MSQRSTIGALKVDLTLASAQFKKGLEAAQKGLRSMSANMKKIGNGMSEGFKKVGQAMKTMAIAGAAAVAAAAVAAGAAITKVADRAGDVDRMSKAFGMTAESYQGLIGGAKKFNIEQDKMNDIIKDSNEKLGEFITTGGGGFKDFMEQVASQQGVAAQDLIQLPPEERFLKMQKMMEAQNLTLEQQSFLWESIASDSTYLIPLFKQGGAELKNVNTALQATGNILSGSVVSSLANVKANASLVSTVIARMGKHIRFFFSPTA